MFVLPPDFGRIGNIGWCLNFLPTYSELCQFHTRAFLWLSKKTTFFFKRYVYFYP